MPRESRMWKRREPRLCLAITAVLLAQTAVCLFCWCAAVWRLNARKAEIVHFGAAHARNLAIPLPRPAYGWMLLLVPAATWVVALSATRRLKPEMQRILERWGSLDEDEGCASPNSGQLRHASPDGHASTCPETGREPIPAEAAAVGLFGRARRVRYRFIEAFPPQLWQPRPRGSRPPGGSCDPLVLQALSPASCLPQCETAGRSGRRP